MANETKYVVPKSGLLIRFPNQPKTVLPVVGGIVPWIGPEGRYWRRRSNDGSIDVYEDRADYSGGVASETKPEEIKPVEIVQPKSKKSYRRTEEDNE